MQQKRKCKFDECFYLKLLNYNRFYCDVPGCINTCAYSANSLKTHKYSLHNKTAKIVFEGSELIFERNEDSQKFHCQCGFSARLTRIFRSHCANSHPAKEYIASQASVIPEIEGVPEFSLSQSREMDADPGINDEDNLDQQNNYDEYTEEDE